MIGVLVPRLTDVVLAQIYESIDDTARAAGYNTVVANTRDDPAVQRLRLDGLLSRRVDGLIVCELRDGDELADHLLALGVPFVLTMRRVGLHPSVTTDDLEVGRLAAERFLALGHSVVGVIAGDPPYEYRARTSQRLCQTIRRGRNRCLGTLHRGFCIRRRQRTIRCRGIALAETTAYGGVRDQ